MPLIKPQTLKSNPQMNSKLRRKVTGLEGAIARLKKKAINAKHMARKRLRMGESYLSLDADAKSNRDKELTENYKKNLNQKISKATQLWSNFTQKERDEKRDEKWESNLSEYSMESADAESMEAEDEDSIESEDEEVNNEGTVEDSEGKETDEECGNDIAKKIDITDVSVRIDDRDSDSQSYDSYDDRNHHDEEERDNYMDEDEDDEEEEEEEEEPEFLYWLGYPPRGERTWSEWYHGTTSQNVASDGKSVKNIKHKFLFG